MEGSDVLTVIAEISIAFTGFTGVVGALVVGSGIGTAPRVSLRFWSMIEFSLFTLLLALWPFVLHHLGASSGVVWGASSGAAVLVLILHMVLLGRPIRALRREHRWQVKPAALDQAVPLCIYAALASQVLNLLGMGLGRDLGGFLLGLFLLVAISAVNFVDLMLALRQESDAE